MINSLLLNKRQMIDITNDHSDKKLQKKLKTYMLNDNDWQIIEYLKPLLFVFYERTRYSSKRSSRASAIIPTQIIINDTIQVVNNPITSTEIFASILKNIFNEKMEKYKKCESILLLMSRLDPQFKNFDFGNMLNELSDNLTREEYLSKKTAFSTSNNNFNYSSNDEFSKYMRPIRKQTETRELDDYVNADGIGLKKKEDESEDPDIMNWWKEHCFRYSHLFESAKALLNCPASSVESERTFSKCSHLMSLRRCNLSGKNLDKIVFISSNKNLI